MGQTPAERGVRDVMLILCAIVGGVFWMQFALYKVGRRRCLIFNTSSLQPFTVKQFIGFLVTKGGLIIEERKTI